MDTVTKEDKAWIAKARNVLIITFVGFALGSITANMTFTYHLMKDCELMKQFRINNLAYECKVK